MQEIYEEDKNTEMALAYNAFPFNKTNVPAFIRVLYFCGYAYDSIAVQLNSLFLKYKIIFIYI